jgi:hypothetical protein
VALYKVALRPFQKVILVLFCLAPSPLWSRIETPPGAIELTSMAHGAPAVFRARVLELSEPENPLPPARATARLHVDRWYRGKGEPEVLLSYELIHWSGHNCIRFAPGSYWLVFATNQGGVFQLTDDCYGAVAVSTLERPVVEGTDVLTQLESDFAAGLEDADPNARIVSIQRLGGLRSASSRGTLHRVIEQGSLAEEDWATYATLRTGDASVLPRVHGMFARNTDVPRHYLAWELTRLTDRGAIPGLVRIADDAPYEEARKDALDALGTLRAVEALPTIARRLSDRDWGVRFYALGVMGAITNESSCLLPLEPRWTDDMVDPQIDRCLTWWNHAGKARFSQVQ